MQIGRVIKKISNNFWVESGTDVFTCIARGKIKDKNIYVGDIVRVTNNVIEDVEKRKTLLVRPPLANLSQLIITVAPLPKPDYIVVDKLLLFCYSNGIKPIICVNKSDMSGYDEILEYCKFAYGEVTKIISTSANNDVKELIDVLKDNISAFAGQSAVGKSALIKAIFPDKDIISGDLSRKIQRGKNTTRHSELFMLDENTYVADSSGFSSLNETLIPIAYYELAYYYPDYVKYMDSCKYKSCSHIDEKECQIKKMINQNKLDKNRYERYKILFLTLKEYWRKNHG